MDPSTLGYSYFESLLGRVVAYSHCILVEVTISRWTLGWIDPGMTQFKS